MRDGGEKGGGTDTEGLLRNSSKRIFGTRPRAPVTGLWASYQGLSVAGSAVT